MVFAGLGYAQGTQNNSCLNVGVGIFIPFILIFILTFFIVIIIKSNKPKEESNKNSNLILAAIGWSILSSFFLGSIALELMC